MAPEEMILCGVCSVIFISTVAYIGNKIVDKSSDAIRNKSVRKQNAEKPRESERLAERFEKGRKL